MDSNALAIAYSAEVELDVQKTPEETAFIVKQAAKLVRLCITSYPNSDKYPNAKAVTNAVNLWANYFADDDWRVVALAVGKHIANSKWPPSIAEIRERMVEITRPDLIPPDEAWTLVSQWLHNTSEYDDNAERVFPAIIAETIAACGGKSTLWALLREQYSRGKAGLDKMTFLQIYEPRYQRERQRAMTPYRLQSDIETAQTMLGNAEHRKLEASRDYVHEQTEAKRRFYDDLQERNNHKVQEMISAKQGHYDEMVASDDSLARLAVRSEYGKGDEDE